MSHPENPSIPGELDRVTGKSAAIYTPPEDLVEAPNVPSEASRVASYAETALEARCLTLHPERPDRVCRECRDFALTGLRAEVARLRDEVRGFKAMRWPEEAHRLQQQRNAALAEVAGLRDRLGRVEALAGELDRLADHHDKAGRRYFARGEQAESIALAATATATRNAATALRAALSGGDDANA